jgi:glyoxylase-like metal-dependent hydrolase (beta-lactamase superfamily II)
MKKFMVVLMMLFVVGIFGLDSKKREPRPSVISYKMADGIFKLFVHDYVNMFVFNGPEGAMLIDTGLEPVNLIADELKRLDIGKILYIVNTHSNSDHILGNPLLGKEAVIISHSRCSERMAKREGFPADGLPDLVFKDEISLSFNGEEIRMFYLPGHTDNDIVIHFQKAKMVFIGDLVFSDSFPGIQAFNGGDVFDLETSLRKLTEIFPPEVTFLVGHGRDYSMKDIREYHTMVRQTIDIVTEMIRKGMDLDEIKNRRPLQKWESWNSEFVPGEISTDTWIENIYVSFKEHDGSWGEPVNLGTPVNSEASEFTPSISPDDRHMFFSSYRTMNPKNFQGKTYHELMSLYRDPRNGYATLFWVDAKIIDNARTKTTGK